MENKYKTLTEQIWTTRISRVNAEKRLVAKESFAQCTNIYYSIFTIIFSIQSMLEYDQKLSTITVFMDIFLFPNNKSERSISLG